MNDINVVRELAENLPKSKPDSSTMPFAQFLRQIEEDSDGDLAKLSTIATDLELDIQHYVCEGSVDLASLADAVIAMDEKLNTRTLRILNTNHLKKECRKATPETLEQLISATLIWCEANKSRQGMAESYLEEHLPDHLFDGLTTAQRLMLKSETVDDAESEDSFAKMMNDTLRDPAYERNYAIAWAAGSYFKAQLGDEPLRYYEVVDAENKIVREVYDEKEFRQLLKKQFSDRALDAAAEASAHWALSNDQCNSLVESYLRHHEPLREPVKPYRPQWEEGWCEHRCAVEPDPSVPCPTFRAFFERHSDGDASAAIIWGTYSGEYRGRKSEYNYSEGNTGRSQTYGYILDRLFGMNKGVGSMPIRSQLNDKHAYTKAYRKSVIFVGECHNPHWFSSDVFKSISGGDYQDIDPKGKAPFTAKIKASVLTLANVQPSLKDQEALKSRMFYSTMAPMNNKDFLANPEPVFDSEFPGLLAYMKQCWETLQENDGRSVRFNERTRQLEAGLLDDSASEWNWFLDEYFELCSEGAVSARDLNKAYGHHFQTGKQNHNDLKFRDFKAHLQSIDGVDLSRTSDGQIWTGIQFKDRILNHPLTLLSGVRNISAGTAENRSFQSIYSLEEYTQGDSVDKRDRSDGPAKKLGVPTKSEILLSAVYADSEEAA